MSLDAASPTTHATVFASAGSGKTWLLVSRLVRLLLAGARPEGILAVTFTRKAAGEMQARLRQRLRTLATAAPDTLRDMLRDMGVDSPSADDMARARGLFEQLLFSPQGVRTTTFHALCQDLLRRFPWRPISRRASNCWRPRGKCAPRPGKPCSSKPR